MFRRVIAFQNMSQPPPESVTRSNEQVYNGCSGSKRRYAPPEQNTAVYIHYLYTTSQNIIYIYSLVGNGLSDACGGIRPRKGDLREPNINRGFNFDICVFDELSVGTCLSNSTEGCGSPNSWSNILK